MWFPLVSLCVCVCECAQMIWFLCAQMIRFLCVQMIRFLCVQMIFLPSKGLFFLWCKLYFFWCAYHVEILERFINLQGIYFFWYKSIFILMLMDIFFFWYVFIFWSFTLPARGSLAMPLGRFVDSVNARGCGVSLFKLPSRESNVMWLIVTAFLFL